MRALALILFLPWFGVLGFAYWQWPRLRGQTRATPGFDAIALVLAGLFAALAADWAFDHDWGRTGPIWPQVAAGLFAYAGWSAVLAVATWLRAVRGRSQPVRVAADNVQEQPDA